MNAGGGIVYVDDDNAGYEDGSLDHPYNTIQEGVNASFSGDTVFVFNGTYYENVVIIKTINLTGENRDITIVDGGGSGDTINVTSSWVNITGFTVTGSGEVPNAGIKLEQVKNCRIFKTNVTNCSIAGIYLNESSNNHIFDNNVFSNHWMGICLRTWYSSHSHLVSNNIISNNTIFSNSQEGILLHYSQSTIITGNNISNNRINFGDTYYNIITNNIISNSGSGIGGGGSYNLIADNRITSIEWDGIMLGGKGSGSKYNTIINNYISSTGRYGIYLFDSSYNEIINNNIYNCSSKQFWFDAGIFLDGDGPEYSSKNNTLSNNNVSCNFQHGIHLYWAANNTITNNIVSNNDDYGIYFQSPPAPSSKSHITNNTVYYNLEGIYIESWGCVVAGNNVFKNKHCGVTFFGSRYGYVTDNNVFSNRNDGIYLYSSDYVDITNNNVWKNINGIHIASSSSNTHISNNNVSNNVWNGVFLDSAINAEVINNDFTDDGVFIKGQNVLEYFNSHTITDDNIVNGQPLYYYKNSSGLVIDGISLGELIIANCTDFIIKNLEINSTDAGIEVLISSKVNITNNNISKNNYGYYLCLASNTSITNNRIYSSKAFGIHLTTSWDNSIYHNYIINNLIQAYDDRNDNTWNDSYPSGGNYWSDFNEPSEGAFDEYRGQDQSVSGGDGIVDLGLPAGGINPYVIDSDSQDVYPLTDFEGNYLFLFEGWNLISLPFIQTDTDLKTVLQSIEGAYDTVEWYKYNANSDHWKVYNTYKPAYLIDLHDLDHKMGFWIHVTKPGGVLFEYYGTEPSVNQNILLHPGWNIVGYPSLNNKNRTAALNNIDFGTDVDFIWTWDGAMQKWGEIGETDYFEVSRGYWIYSNVEKVWDVPL